jgi:hypothetical protein
MAADKSKKGLIPSFNHTERKQIWVKSSQQCEMHFIDLATLPSYSTTNT